MDSKLAKKATRYPATGQKYMIKSRLELETFSVLD